MKTREFVRNLAVELCTIAGGSVALGATVVVGGGGSSLQDAVETAQAGDVLMVEPGWYWPVSTGGKSITIQSTGGADVTFIDGGGTNRCASLGASGAETNTVLTGFTLTNGWTSGDGGGSCFGTLNDCVLVGNVAEGRTAGGGGSFHGILDNCLLTNNFATFYGGGSYYSTLNNCVLAFNISSQGGGASYSTLNNCALTDNTAFYGGGAFICILDNCLLANNTAMHNGGGATGGFLDNCKLTGNTAANTGGGACEYFFEFVLNNCILENNTALQGGGAAGGTLNNCIVTNNTATYGGGLLIAGSGAMINRVNANNCLIADNAADQGGAVYVSLYLVEPGDFSLNNCTLAGNISVSGAALSGFFFALGMFDNVVLRNSIFWGNTNPNGTTNNYDSYICTFYNSCTWPMPTGACDGANNINDDPMFADAAGGDYRLGAGSKCVDAGDNGFVTWEFDLVGNMRIWNGAVDMGAYESGVPPPEVMNYAAWLALHGEIDTPENKHKWITGLNPKDPGAKFLALIGFHEGQPSVKWEPDLGSARVYTIQGKTNLTDSCWHSPTNNASKFFRVKVETK